MTRVITLDPDQRERMVAILGSILDNEHDKWKMGSDNRDCLTEDRWFTLRHGMIGCLIPIEMAMLK